jgi:GNAT superfamily N-acetyltransferase
VAAASHATPAELRRVLEVVLWQPGLSRSELRRHVDGFLEYLRVCPVQWEALRRGPAETPDGLAVSLLIPGGTAIIMFPVAQARGIVWAEQEAVLREAVDALAARRLHYAQVLLAPEHSEQIALALHVGFRPVAPLIYLERDVVYPWVDPPAAGAAEWLTYDQHRADDFARVVRATYEQSLDCPELTDLRPVEDTLAAHRATGRFEPELWQLARIGNQYAGVLLLNWLANGPIIEVGYMGVVPEFRRRGVGALLLQRALERSRERDARQLTIVVDERNAPARRLYARMGLRPVATRNAYVYRWREPALRSGE